MSSQFSLAATRNAVRVVLGLLLTASSGCASWVPTAEPTKPGIEATDETDIAYVLGGHAPLTAARAELVAAEAQHDSMRLAHAHAVLADLNEGAITASAKAVLHGLGFAEFDSARPVRAFSGGWRNRLALARTLLRPADLLLLDEPTNHLDLDSVVWLESWLKRQPATVLVITNLN